MLQLILHFIIIKILLLQYAKDCMAYKYSFGSEKILTKKDGKMKDTLEIRWHGRGGQGAKTAALLLAEVAFKTGKNAQGFP